MYFGRKFEGQVNVLGAKVKVAAFLADIERQPADTSRSCVGDELSICTDSAES